MEFGISSKLPAGSNIIGVSWTAQNAQSDANLLISTSESRIQIHTADDQRVIASWLTRPGDYNKFSTAAVQHRLWRQLFVVQNGTKLFAWHEKHPSLEAATKVKLNSEVFSLRTSKHIPALVCVYKDGGVSVFNEKLAELFNSPGSADGRTATWARLTSVPGQAGRCVLMILTQSPAGGAGAALPPLLRVYTLAATQTAGQPATCVLKFVSTFALQPPAASAASSVGAAVGKKSKQQQGKQTAAGQPAVAAITLHKHLQQLGVFWSTGDMQMLKFGRGTAWYGNPLSEVLVRRIGRLLPAELASGASSSAASASNKPFHCAAFALEPSCVVLAGDHGIEGHGDVGMSVWDVRYGIMLGVKRVPRGGEGSDAADAEGPSAMAVDAGAGAAAASAGRARSDSAASVGSLLSSAQAVSSASLTPDSIFQATVSEDGSFVAMAARRRVMVTPVAVRGASLSSALGKLIPTQALLANTIGTGSGSSVVGRVSGLPAELAPAPVLSMSKCIAAARPTASQASSASSGVDLKAWTSAVDGAATALASDCNAILSPSITPTAASIAVVLRKYGVVANVLAEGDDGDGAPAAGVSSSAAAAAAPEDDEGADATDGAAAGGGGDGTANARKERKRKRKEEARHEAAAAALDAQHRPIPPVAASNAVPQSIVVACVQRCVDELSGFYKCAVAGAMLPASSLPACCSAPNPLGTGVCPILRALIVRGCVSMSLSPDLLPTLMDVASLGKRRGRRSTQHNAVQAMMLLRDVLIYCGDVSESSLVSIYRHLMHKARQDVLSTFWLCVVAQCSTAAAIDADASAAEGSSAASATGAGTADASITAIAGNAKLVAVPLKSNIKILGLLYMTSLLVRAPRNDVFMEAALQSLDGDDVIALLACLVRLLGLHSSKIVGAHIAGAAAGSAAVAASGAGSSSGRSGEPWPERPAGEWMRMEKKPYVQKPIKATIKYQQKMQKAAKRAKLEAEAAVDGSSGAEPSAAAPSTSSSSSSASASASSFTPLLLPSYGQVLDWIRMIMDAHFARLVLMAKSDSSDSKAGGIRQVLADVSKVIQLQVTLCDAAADLRGHLAHILQRQPLPQPPEPDYAVDILRI